jgi:hypothetical protein
MTVRDPAVPLRRGSKATRGCSSCPVARLRAVIQDRFLPGNRKPYEAVSEMINLEQAILFCSVTSCG